MLACGILAGAGAGAHAQQPTEKLSAALRFFALPVEFLARGAIRYPFSDKWYFVSAPIIVANWDADDKWLVPVGGGIGRSFTHNGHPWAWSVQGYVNAITPDPAPDWILRFQVVAAIPFGN